MAQKSVSLQKGVDFFPPFPFSLHYKEYRSLLCAVDDWGVLATVSYRRILDIFSVRFRLLTTHTAANPLRGLASTRDGTVKPLPLASIARALPKNRNSSCPHYSVSFALASQYLWSTFFFFDNVTSFTDRDSPNYSLVLISIYPWLNAFSATNVDYSFVFYVSID